MPNKLLTAVEVTSVDEAKKYREDARKELLQALTVLVEYVRNSLKPENDVEYRRLLVELWRETHAGAREIEEEMIQKRRDKTQGLQFKATLWAAGAAAFFTAVYAVAYIVSLAKHCG